MNKKVISIILGVTLVMSGAAFAGCNKKEDSKAASNKITVEGKKAKEDKKAENTKDEINDPTSPKYVPKEQQNVKDYKEETQTIGNSKVKVFKGTFTNDNLTYWIGGKLLDGKGSADTMLIFDSSVKNAYEASVSGPTEKLRKIENATVMKMGTSDLGSNQYALINYTKPYNFNSEKAHMEVCKVVKSDSIGITVDSGKKYYAKDIKHGVRMEDLNYPSEAKKYSAQDFPKNTLVCAIYLDGKLYQINRYCIIK